MRFKIITLLLIVNSLVYAAPQRFDFTFLNSSSGARADGFIIFESSLLPNPSSGNRYQLPDPAILDLQVTVSGSATGDGTFTLTEFSSVLFSTDGVMLDFSRELVGQDVEGTPWGPPQNTKSQAIDYSTKGRARSEFNFISNNPQQGKNAIKGISTAPSGVDSFVLAASGGSGVPMALISFRPAAVRVIPTLNFYALMTLMILLSFVTFLVIRKSRYGNQS